MICVLFIDFVVIVIIMIQKMMIIAISMVAYRIGIEASMSTSLILLIISVTVL